jgi:hypothetical protein
MLGQTVKVVGVPIIILARRVLVGMVFLKLFHSRRGNRFDL